MRLNVSFKEQNMQMNTKMSEGGARMGVGFSGTQTINGKDGLSAYEIAVKNGFEGSEQEWLESLKGEPGRPGRDGLPGADGLPGKDGYTPVKGVDYFDGKDGQPGEDGYTPVKGIDYFDGAPGEKGEPGYTPVKGVDYFDGKDGKDGAKGDPGYTPVRGTDYWTASDKAAMVQDVLSALPVYNGEVADV